MSELQSFWSKWQMVENNHYYSTGQIILKEAYIFYFVLKYNRAIMEWRTELSKQWQTKKCD